MELHASMGHDHFLIDDFPKNEDDLSAWARQTAGTVRDLFSVHLDCSEAELKERCDDQAGGEAAIASYISHTLPLLQTLDNVRKVQVSRDDAAVWTGVQEAFKDTKIETTYAMIKPDITAVKKEKHIKSHLRAAGFDIIAERRTQFT